MIQINNMSYEAAYEKALKDLLIPQYKIDGDIKIGYETTACFNFDHLINAAELNDCKFYSHYNYDNIIPNGNKQMELELEYYKKLFLDSGKINDLITILNKNRCSKHAIIKLSEDYDTQQPCQIYQFIRILNNKLYVNTHMRANNVIGLLLMDMHLNNAIAIYIAKYLGVPAVKYTHFVDSLHLYKRDLEFAFQTKTFY